MLVFVIYPIISNVVLSVQSWKGIFGMPKEFVGAKNYVSVLTSGSFWRSMANSGIFLIVGFLIQMPLSFALALLISSKLKGVGAYKTVYYLPVILGTTIVAVMWKNLLNPNYGAVTEILKGIGLEAICTDWLRIPWLNVVIVALLNCWKSSGYNMLIFYAGLVAIPDELNEAARIDGCTGLQLIRYLTFPLCKNSFMIYSVLCITGCLKTFDFIWAMTAGGPNGSSATPGILLYLNAYTYKLMGRSASIAIILIVLGVFLSLICNRIFKQEEL